MDIQANLPPWDKDLAQKLHEYLYNHEPLRKLNINTT